jgi:hypothetical protein
MVDCDPQQRAELCKAILVLCQMPLTAAADGWHLVEQGWKSHGPGKPAVKEVGHKRDKYNRFKKCVKDWYYSWMTPGGMVESEDEYFVSKQQLFAYLPSEEVIDACDGQQ